MRLNKVQILLSSMGRLSRSTEITGVLHCWAGCAGVDSRGYKPYVMDEPYFTLPTAVGDTDVRRSLSTLNPRRSVLPKANAKPPP